MKRVFGTLMVALGRAASEACREFVLALLDQHLLDWAAPTAIRTRATPSRTTSYASSTTKACRQPRSRATARYELLVRDEPGKLALQRRDDLLSAHSAFLVHQREPHEMVEQVAFPTFHSERLTRDGNCSLSVPAPRSKMTCDLRCNIVVTLSPEDAFPG